MTEQVQSHILDKYNLIKKVGSGAYGHVWKVTDKMSGEFLALKKIFDAFQHSTDAQRTYREIVFLHELNHPNIIKLHNVIRAQNDKDLYLLFQFMEADLHNAIGQKILKDAHNRYIIYQLMKGLKFMHSAEVIHRDLKPSNLLLNSDCHLKICDFGLARSLAVDKIDNKDAVLTQEVATRWYRAPEVLLGSNYYDKSADIWSAGCILAQILIGKPVFPGNSTLNQLQRILAFTGKPKASDIDSLNSETALSMINEVNVKQRPLNEWFKATIPQEAIQLVTSMLSINPKKRPTATQVLKHPYLLSFYNQKEDLASDKVIHPPISDNKKLNVKEYRKLIYERIKKLYSDEKEGTKTEVIVNEIKKVPQKSIKRQAEVQTQPKTLQKKQVHVGEENTVPVTRNQKVERPASQICQKKSTTVQGLINNSSLCRNTKTNNSTYMPQKNAPRYSSAQNQKKTVSNYIAQKYSTSSFHHSSSANQYSSEQAENVKRKNSLKDILKVKRQNTTQSHYNPQIMSPSPIGSKSHAGFYSYIPQHVLISSSNTGTKHYAVQAEHFNPTMQPHTKYYSYSSNTQQQPAKYGNYTTIINKYSPNLEAYKSTYQSQKNNRNQNSSYKQNNV